MNDNNIQGIDSQIPPQNAVSVYSQDAMDDFPVLKAFQQYIDAEQAKARKRILSLGIFFGVLTGAIIAVFVVLLINMTMRNQQLNDRLLDFAMKDRDRAPVVVQSTPQADNSALMASLASKFDALQSKVMESQASKAAPAAAPDVPEPQAAVQQNKVPTAEALEIEKLKALLAAEREKSAVERERRRQEELEEYRKKHYPELYRRSVRHTPAADRRQDAHPSKTADEEIEEILSESDDDDDEDAITYFDEMHQEAAAAPKPAKKPAAKPAKKPAEENAEKSAEPTPEPAYSIPVDVKKPKRMWHIPAE